MRSAVFRRAFADARVRTLCFVALFALYAYANPVGYRHSYPTLAERLAFERSFGANAAIRLFYGVPHDLLTVGGYTAWRVGGVASIFAAVWAVFAAVRALRAEEDAGRQELVLAGTVSRREALVSALAAVGAGALLLWVALVLGFVGGHLATGPSAYLALAIVSPIPVFVGVGAVVSQVAPSRRIALELGLAVLLATFLLRVVADTAGGLGALRWATPLGWVEELRPFATPRPLVLTLPAAASIGLLAVAAAISARRDVGSGLIGSRDDADPRVGLLGSPLRLAFRLERATLGAWAAGVAIFAVVVGVLSTSFTDANLPANLREQIRKLGGASLTNPAGALGLYFTFFVLVISLFACAQVSALRREEADEQLETLLALPVERHRWLGRRLLLAGLGATGLAGVAALGAWAGSAAENAGVSLPRLLEAGVNCLPAALLFLAIASLAFAVAPRAAAPIAYGVVTVAFVWNLLAELVGAPHWLVILSPFEHVALVPAQPFRAGAAAAMVAVAAAASLMALSAFRRRDLVGQ